MPEPFASTIPIGSDATGERSWFFTSSKKWKRDVAFVLYQARILLHILKNPVVPWYAKAVAGCAVAYIFSPVQLIPSFIPLIGQLDDLLVLFVGMKLLRKLVPDTVFTECEARARP
jgi:uncharacterized membrane protein YkvA (DUF1232 family)